jgi:ABC-type spermidine/putrescine transport system permease subunit I
MSDWHPDTPAALLIAILIIAMYVVPSIIGGVRTYRRGRDLARELHRERDKPRLFDQDRDIWQ